MANHIFDLKNLKKKKERNEINDFNCYFKENVKKKCNHKKNIFNLSFHKQLPKDQSFVNKAICFQPNFHLSA